MRVTGDHFVRPDKITALELGDQEEYQSHAGEIQVPLRIWVEGVKRPIQCVMKATPEEGEPAMNAANRVFVKFMERIKSKLSEMDVAVKTAIEAQTQGALQALEMAMDRDEKPEAEKSELANAIDDVLAMARMCVEDRCCNDTERESSLANIELVEEVLKT